MPTGRTTTCPRCRERAVPARMRKPLDIREQLGIAVFGIPAWLGYGFVDRHHFQCPVCKHAWRPRLHERHILLQLIAWPILIAGAIIGIGVIWMAVTGQIP